MRILALLLLPVLAFGQIATILEGDSVSTSRLVINSNFQYVDGKILRGSGSPQSNSIPCTSSVNPGTIYLNVNAAARASTLYICERTGALTWEWAGPYATSSTGGVIWRGPWEDTRTYAVQDMVESGGSSYVAIVAHTNSAPPSAFWQLAAAAGVGGGSGSGTVTSVSVASANGLAGTVANATTTPAITLSTTVTGLLKGDGTAISAAGASDVPDLPTSKITSGTMADARIAATNITQHQALLSIGWSQLTGLPSTFAPATHTHAAADITSGTLADARIAGSNVTQHQALLSIGWSQLTGLPSIVGLTATNNAIPIGNGTAFANSVIPDCSNATTGKLLYNNSTRTFSCGSDQTGAGGGGITTLNTLTDTTQTFATGTSGADFNIASATSTHTFNFPNASGSARGLLTSTDWSTFNGKQAALGFTPEQVLTFSAPLSRTSNTISMPAATSSQNGYLASADWVVFNAKQAAITGAPGSWPSFATVATSGAYSDLSGLPASDPAAGTAGLRTLGTGSQQAAAGNDARLSDTRTPTDGSVSTAKIADGAVTDAKISGTLSKPTTGNAQRGLIWWTLDGDGSPLTAKTGPAKYVANACTISAALLDGDVSGSVAVTVERANYTAGSPSWSTISSGFALSSARSLRDTTLTGWTTSVSAGSLLRVSITGTPATTTLATVELTCI